MQGSFEQPGMIPGYSLSTVTRCSLFLIRFCTSDAEKRQYAGIARSGTALQGLPSRTGGKAIACGLQQGIALTLFLCCREAAV